MHADHACRPTRFGDAGPSQGATPHEHVLHGGRREDEHFSGTARNELTEPDEGVSVESQSIEEHHGIRLLACVAWEEQEVPGINLHAAVERWWLYFSTDPLGG